MASSSSSSQHESLLARSCSSLPSIDALVAQLVALHRAQEGDIDDNNNLEGGAAGAGYTLTAKKKVADNYCRWLRYAVTESSPGAIKSLLRLLPYPPEEEATQAAEDDEARKVVKLLLANKLMSKDEEGQASLINISLVTRIFLILSNFVLSTARELHVASEAAADAAVASFAIISVSPGTLVGMIDRGRVSVLCASGFHAVKTLRQSVYIVNTTCPISWMFETFQFFCLN